MNIAERVKTGFESNEVGYSIIAPQSRVLLYCSVLYSYRSMRQFTKRGFLVLYPSMYPYRGHASITKQAFLCICTPLCTPIVGMRQLPCGAFLLYMYPPMYPYRGHASPAPSGVRHQFVICISARAFVFMFMSSARNC